MNRHTHSHSLAVITASLILLPIALLGQLAETTVTGNAPAPTPVYVPPAAPAPAPVVVTPPPAPTPVQAPEPAPEIVAPSGDRLIPTEVKISETSTPLKDLPQSVTVFTEERIEDQAASSIADIVDYTPGISNSQGEGHRDAIVVRGQDRRTSNFFIDGFRDDVQYYRSFYNVDQVEILRGPSALYFGQGSIGGSINRSAKKPILNDYLYTTGAKGGKNIIEDDQDFFEVLTQVDTFGATYSQFDWNRPINENVGFRLNAFYETLENHRDFFDGERIGINPTFAVEFGNNTRLDFSYEFNDHNRFIDRGIPVSADGRPVSRLAGTVFGDPEQNYSELESHVVKAILNHEFNDSWRGKLGAFYGDYEKVYQNYFPSSYDEATDIVGIDGYIDSTSRQNFIIQGDLIGEFNTGAIDHKLLLGAEFISTSSDQSRFNSIWDQTNDDVEFFTATGFALNNGRAVNAAGLLSTNSFTDINDDTEVEVDTYSLYIQDEIAIGNKLDVILGARFDNYSIDVVDNEPGSNNGGSLEESFVSPRFGLVFKPTENISFYGAYSETFEPRSGDQVSDLSGSRALEGNQYSNLEAGVNWNLTNDLALRAAIFELEESSPEVSDFDPGQLVVVDSETTGFELELTGYLNDWWYVSAGYTYLDTEQIDQDGGTGLRTREVPENAFSVWNRFQVNPKLGLGLGVIYFDDSFANNTNTAILPAYTRVDAAAFYQISEKTQLQLNVENLFDEEYFPSAHSTHQITVGAPISASFSLKTKF